MSAQKRRLLARLQHVTGISSCPHWYILLIWTAGALTMAGLTINDFLPLLDDYYNHNVNVELEVHTDDDVPRPNFAVCVPHYSAALDTIVQKMEDDDCLECRGLENHSWDVWTDHEEPVEWTSDLLATELMKKLLAEDTSGDYSILLLEPTKFNWNQPLVDAVWLFFCAHSRFDHQHLTNLKIESPFDCPEFNLTNIGSVSTETLDTLHQPVLKAIYTYFEFSLADTEDSGDPVPSTRLEERPLVFTALSFCFPADATSIGEDCTLGQEVVDDPTNITALAPWRRAPITWYRIHRDDSPLYTGLASSNILYETKELDPSLRSGEVAYFAYSMTTKVVEKRETELQRCSWEQNEGKCLMKKQVDLALEYCRCLPFTYKWLVDHNTTADLPYCNEALYQTCQEQLQKNLQPNQEFCKKKCEYIVYDWLSTHIVEDQSLLNTGVLFFAVAASPVPKPYILYQMAQKISLSMFISQTWGLVGGYMGIDGMMACALVILFLEMSKRPFQAGDPEEPTEPQPVVPPEEAPKEPPKENPEANTINDIVKTAETVLLLCHRMETFEKSLIDRMEMMEKDIRHEITMIKLSQSIKFTRKQAWKADVF